MQIVFLLCVLTLVALAQDLTLVRTKLSTCKDFDVLYRDDADTLIDGVYGCMVDTRLFRIERNLVAAYFRAPIDAYIHALRHYEELNHEMIFFDRDARRTLRQMQRNVVAIRMNTLYLITESGLPSLTHLSNEREVRRIKEYLLTNAKTMDYLKSIPLALYISQLQNITHYADDLSQAIQDRDTTQRVLEDAKRSFMELILSKYVL